MPVEFVIFLKRRLIFNIFIFIGDFYWVVFIRLTLFFQAWFGLVICVTVLKEFISMFNKETEKRNFVTFHGDGCKEGKILHQ